MAIPDEPVRGRPPPPWYRALSGIDRVRAVSRGLVPRTALSRLLGIRTTHVAAGSATLTMPVSELCVGPYNQIEISCYVPAALEAAATTALEAGAEAVPLNFVFEPMRPTWSRPGNLIARARVLDSGRLFILAELQLEDPDGRHLGRAGMRCAIRRVEPAPPVPPETIPPVEEPAYDSPDPYLRKFSAIPFPEASGHEGGLEFLQKYADGTFISPMTRNFGIRSDHAAEGELSLVLGASEWFCDSGTHVSGGILAGLANQCATGAAWTATEPGETLAPLEGVVDYLLPVPADGRRLRAEGKATRVAPDRARSRAEIRDEEGTLVATHSISFVLMPAERRASRDVPKSRRVLATLLFTDIVESTAHAGRMGDAPWQELLERHKLSVRQEVSRHNGVEVDAAGDGVFVRFDSPAQAIEAARALRAATESLGVQIRAGIHTGECELVGTRLAGIAVHVAARIQAAAAPGEILVSSTVKDLSAGAHIRFEDRGSHELKGVPDPWRLYAVTD